MLGVDNPSNISIYNKRGSKDLNDFSNTDQLKVVTENSVLHFNK